MSDALLTAPEAAERLRVSVRTVQRLLAALLHASLHRRDALQTESLRNGLNQRGRSSSMTHFSDVDGAAGGGYAVVS